MPELAFGYLIGLVMTAGLTALHFYLQVRKLNSSKMQQLQKNLRRIRLFWSESESALKEFSEDAEKKDRDKTLKSILISGLGFMIFSWLGFIFQFILMLSIRYLAVRRIEKNIFDSELVEKDLLEAQIQEITQTLV